MSEAVQTALIVAIAPTLTALAGVIVSLNNRKEIKAVHSTVNGKLSEILDNSKAAGKQEEREEEEQRKEDKTDERK